MDFKKLETPAIIVAPSSIKRDLVKEKTNNCPLLNIKFIDKEELREGAFYSYDYEAVYEIHKTFGYHLDNAEEILKNAYLVGDSTSKMKDVKNIRKHLEEKHLLKSNPHFASLFKNKKVYVYGYSESDIELQNTFKTIGIKPTFLADHHETVKRDIINFKDISEEITYVANEIFKLHDNGVSLNNIFIYSPSGEYISELKKISYFFGLPMELGETRRLFDSPICKRFISLLEEHTIEEAYKTIQEETKVDTYDAIGRIANCVNNAKFLLNTPEEFKELFEYIAKKTNLKSIHYEESVKVVDSSFSAGEKDHVFVMGFSLGEYPVVARDRDFYLDEEKKKLGLNDSKTQSKINEIKLIDFLNKTPNLIITRRKKNGKEKYFDSLLKDKLGYKDVKGVIPDECYSEEYAKLLVGRARDLKETYGIDSRHVETYTKEKLGFKSFDHEYTMIPEAKEGKDLYLSYSQIQEYNKCPYQYFLKRILKLQAFEDSFFSKLGTLFHKIIEEGITKVQTAADYEQEVLETFETESERHFIRNLLPQAFQVAAINREFHSQTTLNNVKTEDKQTIKVQDGVFLTGAVDKALIDEKNKLIAVVDYKTGSVKIDKSLVDYGLSLQLPLYALMLKEAYKGYGIAGLYIQNVLEDPHDEDSTGEYKLKGFTLDDENVIKKLDSGLGIRLGDDGKIDPSSKYIASLKVTSKGQIDKRSSIADTSFFDSLADSAKEGAILAAEKIISRDFRIEPLVKDEMHDNPCQYCPCKDICLKKGKDAIGLKEYKDKYDKYRDDRKKRLELEAEASLLGEESLPNVSTKEEE